MKDLLWQVHMECGGNAMVPTHTTPEIHQLARRPVRAAQPASAEANAMKKFLAVIQSKWFIACGVVVLALLVTADWKQIQQAREVQAQINGLADQANSLEQKNRDLLSTLSALKGAGAAEAAGAPAAQLEEAWRVRVLVRAAAKPGRERARG